MIGWERLFFFSDVNAGLDAGAPKISYLSLSITIFVPSLYNNRMGQVGATSTRTGWCGDSLFSFDCCKEFGTPHDFKCQYDDQFWPKFWPFLSSVKILPLIPCNQ